MWCKFRAQALTNTHYQASDLSYTLTQAWQWVVQKSQTASLGVLLGLGGGFWLIGEAFAPQIAQADKVHVNLPVNRQPNESYETLVRRAEAVALATTQQKFHQNVQVTNVSVTIVGQNKGEIAPVLSLQVSRPQWHKQMKVCSNDQYLGSCLPNSPLWVRYFTDARSLLGFEDNTNTTPSESETTNQTTPEKPPNSIPSDPGTANPTTTPSQTPEINTSDDALQSPDAVVPVDVPDSSQDPTGLPNVIGPGSPSTPTPVDAQEAPLTAPPISVPDSNGIIQNNNPVTTPTTPNTTIPGTLPSTPDNLNNTTPGTIPQQNLDGLPIDTPNTTIPGTLPSTPDNLNNTTPVTIPQQNLDGLPTDGSGG